MGSRKSNKNREADSATDDLQTDIPEAAARTLQSFLSQSFAWSGRQLEKLSDSPFMDRTGFAQAVKKAGEDLHGLSGDAPRLIRSTLDELHGAFEGAFQATMESYQLADNTVKRSVLENVPAVSITGKSFRNPDEPVVTSLREDGRDISTEEFLKGFGESGMERLILFLPGLFSDESLWKDSGTPFSFLETARGAGCYPGCFRFNPTESIPKTGYQLLQILKTICQSTDVPIDIVCYSEGGLLLRSALYQDQNPANPGAVDGNGGSPSGGVVTSRIRHALVISAPDGGSFLEKMGFWLGLGLAGLSQLAHQLVRYPELDRSPAISDLGHGRIRPDEGENYGGELDSIMATQIYSLVSKNNNVWESWLGDGVVEETSLAYLSASVYGQKPNPEDRVHCLLGRNHFQILNDPAVIRIMRSVLAEDFQRPGAPIQTSINEAASN